MICTGCRRMFHEDCPGGTWCDCQHDPGTSLSTEAIRQRDDSLGRPGEVSSEPAAVTA